MKRKTQQPRLAILLTATIAFGISALPCTSAWAQAVPATSAVPSAGQNGTGTPNQPQPNGGVGAVEVLSDTRGVDFNPYLKGILSGIYGRWTGLLPNEAHPPTLAEGETDIRFTITPNGQIAAMHLDGSTHDDQLNKAAWGAISGVQQFPPLPAVFTGPNLELRVHFRVNLPASASTPSAMADSKASSAEAR